MIYNYSQHSDVVFGAGAIKLLGEKVRELGCKKALVIYNQDIKNSGAAQRALDSLSSSGVASVSFEGVLPDPPMEVIDAAGELGVSERVDCIIGIGGGSTLDTAKATSILMTNPGPIKQYILHQPIKIDTRVPVILIPTTAGTGSECTHVAIVTRTDLNEKWSVFVNITLAIVDPELTLSLPRSVTVYTGLDAFSHAAECLTSTLTDPRSELLALDAIRRISHYLPIAAADGSDLEARTELSMAANLAGIAFDDASCHVGHSIADGLSVTFHTPHGLNCALALPVTMELVGAARPGQMTKIAQAMGLSVSPDATGEALGALVGRELRRMMRALDVPSLASLGHSREATLANAAAVADNHLTTNCPAPVSVDTAEKLLASVYDDYR